MRCRWFDCRVKAARPLFAAVCILLGAGSAARAVETTATESATARELVDVIAAKVSEMRRLPLLRPIEFELVNRDQVQAFVLKTMREELPPDHVAETEHMLKLLGAIPQDTDLHQTILDLLTEQAAGIYDRRGRKLLILKHFDLDRPLGKIILAHEICHALQDQHFDMERMPIPDPVNDDLSAAALAALEGDATILMGEYMREAMGGPSVAMAMEMMGVDQKVLNNAPSFLRKQLLFPYLSGMEFHNRLVWLHGRKARDMALRDLPVSTEQIIHPEKYMGPDRDPPTSVTLPDLGPRLGDGWKKTFENVFGEMQIRSLFEVWRMRDVAAEAAAGWDGDSYAVYRNGDGHHFIWESVWDTEADAAEFADTMALMLRTKRYRNEFPDGDWETSGSARILSRADGDGEGRLLMVTRDRRQVGVTITNRPDALRDR